MKRVIALLCSVAMICLLASCSKSSNSETDYSNQTLTGQVTSVDDTKVTLQLGELGTQGGMQRPDENGGNQMQGDKQTPPEIPDGEDRRGYSCNYFRFSD